MDNALKESTEDSKVLTSVEQTQDLSQYDKKEDNQLNERGDNQLNEDKKELEYLRKDRDFFLQENLMLRHKIFIFENEHRHFYEPRRSDPHIVRMLEDKCDDYQRTIANQKSMIEDLNDKLQIAKIERESAIELMGEISKKQKFSPSSSSSSSSSSFDKHFLDQLQSKIDELNRLIKSVY